MIHKLCSYLSKRKLLRNIKRNKINKAYLQGVDLSYTNLSGIDLSGAKMQYCNLKGANLKHTNLQGADLSNSNLKNAKLSEANLIYTNLSYANLTNAKLNSAKLFKTVFINANLTNASLQHVYVDNTTNFTKAILINTFMDEEKLHRAIITDATINLRKTAVDSALFWFGISPNKNLKKIRPL